MKKITFLLLVLFLLGGTAFAQREDVISDESKVPAYELPDVLTLPNDGKVNSEKAWFNKQRPYLLSQFTSQVYGKVPGRMKVSEVKVWETDDNALNGQARRKQLSPLFNKGKHSLEVNVLMYLPKTARKSACFS